MKPKFWFVLAGIGAVLALIIGLLVVFSHGSGPRGYVADKYQRAAHLDLSGDSHNRAYTSTQAPAAVVAAITAKFRPAARHADGSGSYLRYSDDAVVVQPNDRGAVIHVLDVEDAYRRYHSHIGGFWGYTGTHGETFRGRGPGTGK